MDGASANARNRQRRPSPYLSPESDRPGRVTVSSAEVALIFPAGGRPTVVHGAVRTRQLDHGLPGPTVPATPCADDPRGADSVAGEGAGRLPRCRAGEDPARAATGRAHRARRAPAQSLLRHARRDAALPDLAGRVRALARRPRLRAKPAAGSHDGPGMDGAIRRSRRW